MDDDGLAVARDVSDFFECPVGDEDRFRNEYKRLHLAQQNDAVPATAAVTPKVVLASGDAQVGMSEEDYVGMLGEHGLKPPVDGKHSTLAVLWLAQSASKRGMADLAKELMDLRTVGRGLVFVRRPDGSFFTPKPVTAIKLARAEEEQQAVAVEVEAFFADE